MAYAASASVKRKVSIFYEHGEVTQKNWDNTNCYIHTRPVVISGLSIVLVYEEFIVSQNISLPWTEYVLITYLLKILKYKTLADVKGVSTHETLPLISRLAVIALLPTEFAAQQAYDPASSFFVSLISRVPFLFNS